MYALFPILIGLMSWLWLALYGDENIGERVHLAQKAALDSLTIERERRNLEQGDDGIDDDWVPPETEELLAGLQRQARDEDFYTMVFWVTIYSCHTQICSALLHTINCTWQSIDNQWLLLRDSEVVCFEGSAARWQLFFFFFLVLYSMMPFIPVLPLTGYGSKAACLIYSITRSSSQRVYPA